MNLSHPFRLASALRRLAAITTIACAGAAMAHGSVVGDIHIGHPFATPSLAGTTTGAAYFARLDNEGTRADRLLRASTPAAARVELHSMALDAQGVMRMREIEAIELAPKASIRMRPGMGMHLMLVGLKAPLREGASFPMTLEFERAGKVEVTVTVQVPKPRDEASGAHMH
jgi:periplasmic copper chaperone A